jgi:MOSC domain-containing protein YiiM
MLHSPELPPLQVLMAQFAQPGRVEWIGVRPARREPVRAVAEVQAEIGTGLAGDRYRGAADSKRQVTLVQGEHLDAVAALLGRPSLEPELVRRNIVVRGLNLLALKDKRFRLGEALLEYTGPCHPCSRMEEVLGPGGYNALRGHGGITARVLEPGRIRVGDALVPV